MKRLVLWVSIVGALVCGTTAIVVSWDDLYALVYPESRLWGEWVGQATVAQGVEGGPLRAMNVKGMHAYLRLVEASRNASPSPTNTDQSATPPTDTRQNLPLELHFDRNGQYLIRSPPFGYPDPAGGIISSSFDDSGTYRVIGGRLTLSSTIDEDACTRTIRFNHDYSELWLLSGERVEMKLRRVDPTVRGEPPEILEAAQ